MVGLERVIYRSRALIPTRSLLDIAEIVGVSQRNNLRDDVTGILAVGESAFVQVIEGRGYAVRNLLVRLAQDTRHDNMHLVHHTPVTERLFSSWSLVSSHLEPALEVRMDRTMTAADFSPEDIINELQCMTAYRNDPVIHAVVC